MEKFKSFIERLQEILADYDDLDSASYLSDDIYALLDEYHIQ